MLLVTTLMGGGKSHNIQANFFVNYFNGYRFNDCACDIVENFANYQKIYNAFADNISRQIFQNLVNFRLTGDIRYMRGFKVANERQYFECFLDLPNNPIFVDAGGYTGDTALQFIERYPNFEKIFLFEPDKQNIAQAKQNLGKYQNISYIQKGLGDSNKNVRFSLHGLGSSVDENGECVINITKLDDAIKSRVDFIKMDIEGSEGIAIEGAKDTIKKYHPALAICVYHKKDDFWKIPQQVLSLRSDYKLYMRHYTQGIDETVIFFVRDF